jgi:LemA protein
MKKYLLGCGGLSVLLVLVLGMGGCSSYNNLMKLEQAVDSQWAQVQAVYQRRADLIPNLVNTVSGAANFERTTLTEVTQARASVGQVNLPPGQSPNRPEELQNFQRAQDQLGSALSRLLVVVERYPELRANNNFTALQAQLEGTENRITVERQRFNETVQRFNTQVKTIPTRFIAALAGLQPKPYFTAQQGAEQAPKVDFNFGNQKAATNR